MAMLDSVAEGIASERASKAAKTPKAKGERPASLWVEAPVWRHTGFLLRFRVVTCDYCGAVERTVEGFYKQHCLTRNAATTRLERVTDSEELLPLAEDIAPLEKWQEDLEGRAPVCSSCCYVFGFGPDNTDAIPPDNIPPPDSPSPATIPTAAWPFEGDPE